MNVAYGSGEMSGFLAYDTVRVRREAEAATVLALGGALLKAQQGGPFCSSWPCGSSTCESFQLQVPKTQICSSFPRGEHKMILPVAKRESCVKTNHLYTPYCSRQQALHSLQNNSIGFLNKPKADIVRASSHRQVNRESQCLIQGHTAGKPKSWE